MRGGDMTVAGARELVDATGHDIVSPGGGRGR